MDNFNLNHRVFMFAVCSSVEYDLRDHISKNVPPVELDGSLVEKAMKRNNKITKDFNRSDNDDVLQELDLGDLISIIVRNNVEFNMTSDQREKLIKIFDKIIPIRNRVMHTRPLEFGDGSLLEEMLNVISKEIKGIHWKEVEKTRKTIATTPQLLLGSFDKLMKDKNYGDIYNNLPFPEFDDTGYIGRNQELKEIRHLILNNKNQIITIVGNGGIGKTATLVKCLYDNVASEEFIKKFDCIIWTSLKTKSLTDGEFKNINDSIQNVSEMYEFLEDNLVKEKGTSRDNVISFMESFKTLLVIDNLETVVTEDIIDFIKSIPENSKVVLTSRKGLGELEFRYKLEDMKINDALIYFKLLSRKYGLELHKRDEKYLRELIEKNLYSSPLSIKWFITSISNGANEQVLISHKEDIIDFCMSNIINTFNEKQINILQLFLIENRQLAFGEMDYYLDIDTEILTEYINLLRATSMLEVSGTKYQINSMAKDFLSIFYKPVNSFVKEIYRKRSDLNNMIQEVNIKHNSYQFNPNYLSETSENEDNKIASYYLIKALEFSKDGAIENALEYVEKARLIAPNYFEVYKIKGFIKANTSDYYEAIESYRTALENTKNNATRATVSYMMSLFYRTKLNDSHMALKYINDADFNQPEDTNILIEKARTLIFLGKYDEGEEILELIRPQTNATNQYRNKYASRYADLFIRKSQIYGDRDDNQRIDYLKKAIRCIDEVEQIDGGTRVVYLKALCELVYLSLKYQSVKEFCEETIVENSSIIMGKLTKKLEGIKEFIKTNPKLFSDEVKEIFNKAGVNQYDLAEQIIENNKGIVIQNWGNYGFIKNSQGSYYYCNRNDLLIGDEVNFEKVVLSKGKYKGKTNAVNISKLN